MPSSTSSPTVLRWYIALETSRLRKQAGYTLKQVAERLGRSTAHVGHMETGRNLPSRAELEILLDFYDVRERIPSFVELLDSARRGKDWWLPFKGASPAWFDLFLGLESAAAQIESYEAQLIPGLFQTPAYTEAVVRAEEPELTEAELFRRVDLRQARQEILTRRFEPPSVWSILDESVLYGTADKPETMREQLTHLIAVAERPNVNILVLPTNTRPHAGSSGAFSILSFPGLADSPAVGYTESRINGTYHESAEAVLRFRNTLTRLHNIAENAEQSRKRIRRRIEELL